MIENHLESITRVAIGTESWLLNTAILSNPLLLTVALYTLKFRLFHLRYDVTVTNNNTPKCYKFVNVVWAQFSDSVDFPQIVGPYLNDLIEFSIFIHKLVIHVLVFAFCKSVHVECEISVRLGYHEIKDWNDICWIVNNLAVQCWIKLVDVITVNLEHVLVKLPYLLQFCHVIALSDVLLIVIVVIIVPDLLKVVDKVLQLHLDIVCVDVCPPNYLGMRTVFSTSHVIQKCSIRLLLSCIRLIAIWIEHWWLHHTIHVHESSFLLIVRHQGRSVEHTENYGKLKGSK